MWDSLTREKRNKNLLRKNRETNFEKSFQDLRKLIFQKFAKSSLLHMMCLVF
jgi:hypothetical protein